MSELASKDENERSLLEIIQDCSRWWKTVRYIERYVCVCSITFSRWQEIRFQGRIAGAVSSSVLCIRKYTSYLSVPYPFKSIRFRVGLLCKSTGETTTMTNRVHLAIRNAEGTQNVRCPFEQVSKARFEHLFSCFQDLLFLGFDIFHQGASSTSSSASTTLPPAPLLISPLSFVLRYLRNRLLGSRSFE